MKFLFTQILLLVSAVAAQPVQWSDLETRDTDLAFRIYSNNVREYTEKRFPDERPWDERKYGVIEALNSRIHDFPTLVGLQELKHNQLVDVLAGLNGQNETEFPWTHYGVGRDDGVEKGEYSAILYNTLEWDLLNGTYKWLSPTPDVPSYGWDAGSRRIVTMTTFRHKQTGSKVNYFNTHLDNKSEQSRQESTKLIVGWLQLIPNDYPQFLLGDFNSISSDIAYETVADYMADTNVIANIHETGNETTYTGFEYGDHQSVIDFIWAPSNSNKPKSGVEVVGYEVLSNNYLDFRFSDHRPVTSHFRISSN